jgi:hypothetical protein
MRRIDLFAVSLLVLSMAAPAWAQFKEGDPGGTKQGVTQTHKWQAGVIVTAMGGPCKAIVGYVPVPSEWPEQTVKVVDQTLSPGAKISYLTVDEGARVMVVNIPLVPLNEEAKALLTFEVKRTAQLPPEDKDSLQFAEPKSLPLAIHRYLGPGPKIETRDPKIREAAKDVGSNCDKAWKHVEAIYDWVREKVQYKTGGAFKGASAALKDGVGNHDDMTALFIAVCRAADIPARFVWVDQFSYAEFYLLDKKGDGHWFPCAPAGARVFGEMPDTKPILEKGDNFSPPYSKNKKDRQYFLREFLAVKPVANGGQPRVQFVRKPM